MAGKTTQHRKANSWKAAPANDARRDPPVVDAPELRERIAELAYFKAQQRGFEAGRELEDWLAAETEMAGRAGESGTSARP